MGRKTIRHPATHEIGTVGLLFVPGRYLPVGWAATWAARRFLRRYAAPTGGVADPPVADPPVADPRE
jgi:hypothetical protein